MSFAPCLEVGGKRFSFLSRHLAQACDEYHVLARREKVSVEDASAFRGNVHRTGMFPHFSRGRRTGFKRLITKLWNRYLCSIDPFVGWVVPAVFKGIRLNRQFRFNVIIVTVPCFSQLAAAVLLSRWTSAKLVIDYRDPWTNHRSDFPKPLGKWLCPALEKTAIKRAAGAVFCSEIMREQFLLHFGVLAPPLLDVIHNGFEQFEAVSLDAAPPGHITKMVYAGRLYGTRRLTGIANAISRLFDSGTITNETFEFDLYSPVSEDDIAVFRECGVDSAVKVKEMVSYAQIKRVMANADILFLPSGTDVEYAVPFKFFDYLSVRRPILAIAPEKSSVHRLMKRVDCGEFADIDDHSAITDALETLFLGEKTYSFAGAEDFLWRKSAEKYRAVIGKVLTEQAIATTTDEV